MGNTCNTCCTNDDTGQTLVLDQWGLDDEGVEHDFQYHETKLRRYMKSLGAHDAMIRKCTHPLYLL